MVVDYSKWDKLELSDDSDIEVHPNVDKKSFIRWKQRDIHEKRDQAKFRMAQLEVNIETNEDLLHRVRKLIAAGDKGHKVGVDVEGDVKLTQEGEPKIKPAKATSPEQPKYTDMMESMLMQIVAEDGNPQVVLNKLREHEEMIIGALEAERKELAKLEEERKQHITAEDIHTGWDSTIVYKPKHDEPPGSTESAASSSDSGIKSTVKTSTSTVETLNSPGQVVKPKVNEDGLEESLPATEKFGETPIDSMDAAFNYSMKHPYIVTEGQKDALLMTAFEHELAGDQKRARTVVWNSLLIQYSAMLGRDGVRSFFSRIVKSDHPARQAFEQDVETTYNHINNRCKISSAEHENDQSGAAETIQSHAVDPDTESIIGVPDEGSEGRAIYEEFPVNVRAAIESKQLDKINEVSATSNVDEAEELVGKLSESGVSQVDKKIYDEKEWSEKKEELESHGEAAPAAAAEESVPSSIDEVD